MFEYLTTRVSGGYRVTHVNEPGVFFTVTKPNGKMVCDCPEYSQAPKGTCEHISQVIEYHRRNQVTTTPSRTVSRNRYAGRMGTLTLGLPPRPISTNGRTQPPNPNTTLVHSQPDKPAARPAATTHEQPSGAASAPSLTTQPNPPTAATPAPAEPPNNGAARPSPAAPPTNGDSRRPAVSPAASAAHALPNIQKSPTAQRLELAFRPDQIKQKDGAAYLDGASVIQRLNDVLGTENWSFRLLGDPREVREEVIVHGRLTALMNGQRVVKEDYGAHEHTRKRSDKSIVSYGDTLKSAVTDCIKRCAHQLGVGLHLYSKDGSYRSFRSAPLEAANSTSPAPDGADRVEAL